MSLRQLTDSELMAMQQEMQALLSKTRKKEVTPEEAHRAATTHKDLMVKTFEGNASDLRQDTWNIVKDAETVFRNMVFEAERAAGPQFKATDELDLSAERRVIDAKKAIRRMTLNGKVDLTDAEMLFNKDENRGRNSYTVSEEKYSRILISMLNNYGKYIDKDHPIMKELWQMYNDKTVHNYMEYAKNATRNKNRDVGIADKIRSNLASYSDKNFALAVLNLLEPVVPQSKPEEKKKA
jgi:hypothetical protein